MLVAEVSDSLGNPRKGNVCRWKPLQSNGSEDMTVNNSVCVCVCVCVCEEESSRVSGDGARQKW
jgi:hypothetical protein